MNSIFDFILGKILDKPFEIAWGVIYSFLIKYIWNNFIGLRIFAGLAFILGFILIWQFKKIKTSKRVAEKLQNDNNLLSDKINGLLNPFQKRYKLTNEVLYYLYLQKEVKVIEYKQLIDNIEGIENIEDSMEIIEKLVDDGKVRRESYKPTQNRTFYMLINPILTLEGQGYVENLEKYRLTHNK
ncbi:MAG: hypothetical protein WCF95_05790 [bacterium]